VCYSVLHTRKIIGPQFIVTVNPVICSIQSSFSITIHRYILVSVHFGCQYNTLIQAVHIAIQSNATSIINKSNTLIKTLTVHLFQQWQAEVMIIRKCRFCSLPPLFKANVWRHFGFKTTKTTSYC